ncbi:Uncharacterized protein FKW44_021203 [Caligus rogercresseyi]|uniref:BTB domain-containing protein n=1 Tax=Caligus rogercresseyi TaxID=217165 RepID=A0A7T8GRH9_CALRO|nr:Uncharacterized protein FKW44_021203 [Caligus rogercresseyi]
MGSSERLHLRWNDFEPNIKHGFCELRREEDFFDSLRAHRVILSACSPFFKSMLRSLSHEHPLLYLRGIPPSHMEAILSFMYSGEVSVPQDELQSFLALAEELQIKGLTNSRPPSPKTTAKRPRLQQEEELQEMSPQAYDEHEEKAPLDSEELLYEDSHQFLEGTSSSSSSALGPNAPIPIEKRKMDQGGDLNAAFDLEIEKCYRKDGPKEFSCLKCKYRSTKRFSMKSHVECNHFITRGFPCNVCGYICKNPTLPTDAHFTTPQESAGLLCAGR